MSTFQTEKQSLNQDELSSSSTTPPNDISLTDDFIETDRYKVRLAQQPTGMTDRVVRDGSERLAEESRMKPSSSKYVIQTDYESSAAEDFDSYTLSKYESAECALLAYSRTNKIDKLKTLLEAKLRNEIVVSLNHKGQQKQNFSWSALHLACYFGHISVVQALLSKKQFRNEIDINIKNNSGDTALHKAALTNRADIVQLLLSNGANVFIKNCDDLLAKQLTSDKHIFEMLEAAEQADKNRIKLEMFKAVDNGDLKRLEKYFQDCDSLIIHHASEDFGASPSSCPNGNNQAESVESRNDASRNNEQERRLGSQSMAQRGLISADLINNMIDEHGNTLLHLAAMRGFKAICVYLLEHGLDPYRKNGIGQTCIDIASYQLRQLFMTVKPANIQLKRLSNQRVARLEGPLLKKMRILGWKQIYAVLDNGMFLLFNNRRDSINRSRRGFKYLESATCEVDPSDIGMFTVLFSDRSRATFLISTDLISQYGSFNKSLRSEPIKQPTGNQVELLRQKWIDALQDHIVYSTEFVRKGLKINDDDELDAGDNNDISTLNHLLPIDTIKSFFQDARAHYNILERHAESLCSLAQSIAQSSNSAQSNSFDNSVRKIESDQSQQNQTSLASSTGGSRLFGLMRGSRQLPNKVPSEEEARVQLASSSLKARNENLANEFIQDNWSCILFHLRLLMESTENTKTTMSQALALMEHQEQLRQDRIQDQEERCRVLEDSLHALARDHHELEKSLSMSQLYDPARGASRSISMSTDLNEYYDAFEDFDDEKTMTPDSTPSLDELDKRIQDAIDEEPGSAQAASRSIYEISQGARTSHASGQGCDFPDDHGQDVEEEGDIEDDLESNCSALTVETVTEQYASAADSSQIHLNGNYPVPHTSAMIPQARTRLQAPMVPRDQVSVWSILKNCIGKELSKITMPVVFNEPLTMLQRAAEGVRHTRYLKMADMCDDPIERMELVCAFIIACISCNGHRIIKPFNPLLYETYEVIHELDDGSHVKGFAQQVSHHPPISAVCCESDNFIYNGVINPKIKFWGRSIEITHDGVARVYLKGRNETYLFNAIPCSVHNIIVGKLWFEHHGPLVISCHESDIQANLTFKSAGWFSNDVHRFEGFIISGFTKSSSEKKNVRYIYGKWTDYIKSVNYSDYEDYMSRTQQRPFKIPDKPDTSGITSSLDSMSLSESVNNNSIPQGTQRAPEAPNTPTSSKGGDKAKSSMTKSESAQSLDIPNSRTLWRLETQYLSEYYNFTLFTMRLNELTPELEKTLPRTDSRFRLDVRKLEEGDLDGAASEKQRLEDKQREARSRDKRFKEPSADFLFFEKTNLPNSKEKFWLYKGGYWENKCNPEKFPDLF